MRAKAVVLLGLATMLVGGIPVVAQAGAPGAAATSVRHEVDGRVADWAGSPTGVAGTAGYDRGVFSYTGYPYDDRGAGGTFAYPTAAGYNRNAADVVVFQVAEDAQAVHHLFRFDTMLVPDAAVVTLAIDTDGDQATGGGAWPYGADVTTPGWDALVTAWGTGATLTRPGAPPVAIPVGVDTVENTLEVAVPKALADPEGGRWTYRGGAGVWDRSAGSYAEVVPANGPPPAAATSPTGGTGSTAQPDLFDLLFRNRVFDGGTEATDENGSGSFQFAKQSAALAAGDLGPFSRTVDFSLLRSGARIDPAYPTTDAQVTRVFRTTGTPNTLAEGVIPGNTTSSTYNGVYQPYILFVPATYWTGLPTAAPMIPLLHGWLGDHRGFNPGDNAFWNTVVRPNRALVPKPLGRGGEVWYEHIGEWDVLEVMADVARHYRVDEDRIFLGGTSMGGLGTLKISQAHPDLFAGIFPSVPPMSDRATGYAVPAANEWDLVEQADNLRNVPVRNFTGTYDPLVPAGNDSRRLCDQLKALVYDHDCWRDISQSGTHRGFEVDRAGQIAQMIREHPVRVVNPDRVTYEIHPEWVKQAKDNGLSDELPYDSAYWVSGLKLNAPAEVAPNGLQRRATGAGFGRIDARTFGRGGADPVATPIADDPSPTLLRDGLVLTPGTPTAPRNAFTVTTENLSSAAVDLARMALTARQPLTITVTTDQPLMLTLLGSGTGCTAIGGAPVGRHDDRSAAIGFPTGTTTRTITCHS